ncbi:IclR family transcriptional regulator [Haladaptatus halobius]|uniref:IclR family transcriptional regulator n=1 Tax=Haladaptatus halobius TaxID=2884875 RepID=UPI001D0B8D85|nr:IclR family transcriptional regulator [Haladaptatus halobius]
MAGQIKIQSLKKAFDIIEVIVSTRDATLSDIAAQLKLSESTVYDYLITLVELGYLDRDNQKYRINTRFLDMGTTARENLPIFRLSKSEIDGLATKTGEHASLMVEENGLGVLLYIAKGENALDLGVSTGRQMRLPTNAPGKAILANFDRERIEEVLDEHGLPVITDKTITDREALMDELQIIRERGYATDFGERVDGVRAVSVPIVVGNEVHGAITISGPANRMGNERIEKEIPDILMESSNVIEIQYTLKGSKQM